jgi:threonyl-tRNA synthetase
MAQAVQELFPDAKLGIGPPIENGFYYDFDVETPFVPEDLAKIETADAQDHQGGPAVLPPGGHRRRRARELADEPYKLELIGLKGPAPRRRGRRGRRAPRSAPAS